MVTDQESLNSLMLHGSLNRILSIANLGVLGSECFKKLVKKLSFSREAHLCDLLLNNWIAHNSLQRLLIGICAMDEQRFLQNAFQQGVILFCCQISQVGVKIVLNPSRRCNDEGFDGVYELVSVILNIELGLDIGFNQTEEFGHFVLN